jgi:hypothetical protein
MIRQETPMADAAAEFLALATALREAGETGLRKELYKALDDAAEPLAKLIGREEHLKDYMPDRYAGVFGKDFRMRVSKRTTGEPGVELVGSAPTALFSRGRGRKVNQRNAGIITHPVFAVSGTPRRSWTWRTQTKGMRAGFFDRPVQQSGPQVRDQIVAAVDRVRDKIYAAK